MFAELKKRKEDENKIPVLDADGNEQFEMIAAEEYPQTKTASRIAEQLTRLEDRFGLNPSARASVGSADAKPPASGKERFFSA
jgi:phage terminase small subunit